MSYRGLYCVMTELLRMTRRREPAETEPTGAALRSSIEHTSVQRLGSPADQSVSGCVTQDNKVAARRTKPEAGDGHPQRRPAHPSQRGAHGGLSKAGDL